MERYYVTFNQSYQVDALIDIDVRAIVAFHSVKVDENNDGTYQHYTRVHLAGLQDSLDLAVHKMAVIAAIERAFDEDEAHLHEVERE